MRIASQFFLGLAVTWTVRAFILGPVSDVFHVNYTTLLLSYRPFLDTALLLTLIGMLLDEWCD